MKAREIYEHPAATVILAAHADLEQLTLTRQELAFKRFVDDKWSELAYMGLVHEPLFHDLNHGISSMMTLPACIMSTPCMSGRSRTKK